jgi:hypothetical protein
MGGLDGNGFIGLFAAISLAKARFVISRCVCKLDV